MPVEPNDGQAIDNRLSQSTPCALDGPALCVWWQAGQPAYMSGCLAGHRLARGFVGKGSRARAGGYGKNSGMQQAASGSGVGGADGPGPFITRVKWTAECKGRRRRRRRRRQAAPMPASGRAAASHATGCSIAGNLAGPRGGRQRAGGSGRWRLAPGFRRSGRWTRSRPSTCSG